MKKIIISIFIIGALLQFACKKNNNGGPPVVTNVRTPNPAQADSSFTSALPGTLIVIQGHGFDGLQQVYFNDTSAYFNPVYVTSTNIILQIPTYAQTAATNPNVPSTIRIVTSHGSTTYTFKLYEDAPVITAASLDSTGTILTIQGINLIGVKKITFPVPGVDTSPSFQVDTNWQQITAKIPAGTPFNDSVRVYCTFGTASFPYPPLMLIKSISNENAIAGDTITLNGTNFVGIQSVTFPGSIPAANFWTVNVNTLMAVVPSGITAPDTIRISSNALGNASATQLFDSYLTYPSPGYLSTFENQWPASPNNTSFVGWTGSYAAAPTTAYPNGTGSCTYFNNGGTIPGNTAAGGNQGNPGFIQLDDMPWVANTAVPAANYSLKFEIYVASPWKAGTLFIMAGDWYGWTHYLAHYEPWTTAPGNVYQPDGWTTVTIPLSQFINAVGGTSVLISGKTQGPITDANNWDYESWPVGGTPPNLISDFGTTALCFALANDQASPTVAVGGMNIAIDNVRIVQGQ
jgi:hypothetical protein